MDEEDKSILNKDESFGNIQTYIKFIFCIKYKNNFYIYIIMKKYKEYNIIPIGDHCATSIILKELDIRQHSYPFDWITHIDQIHNTNIIYNMQLINELKSSNDIK